MRWNDLAEHLDMAAMARRASAQVLHSFCGWVEGEIEELEEAGPLSAQHKKIKKLVKERAAQHERNELLFTKNSVIAIVRWGDQTCGIKSQMWNSYMHPQTPHIKVTSLHSLQPPPSTFSDISDLILRCLSPAARPRPSACAQEADLELLVALAKVAFQDQDFPHPPSTSVV